MIIIYAHFQRTLMRDGKPELQTTVPYLILWLFLLKMASQDSNYFRYFHTDFFFSV